MAARDRVRDRANNANNANDGGGGGVAVVDKPSSLPPTLQMLTDPRTEAEVAKALPPGLDVKRFLRVARTAVQANPTLLRCEPRSIIAAVHKAAAYGLDVGPVGQCYLVPFKDQAQLVIGYRGMLALARRSGELASIEAREVREHDEFEFEYGLNPKCRHVPAMSDRGEVICYWGLARFTNGGHYQVLVDLDTIAEHRAQSKTADSPSGPWTKFPVQMGKKTTIRVMEPFLPLTADATEAFVSEEAPSLPEPLEYIDVAYDEVGEPEPSTVEPEAPVEP